MRLRRRVQLLLASFLALIVLALGIDVWIIRVRDGANARLQSELVPARTELLRLLNALLDQETGERGYLLTGDERFLETYAEGRVHALEAIDRLTLLVAERDELVAAVRRIQSRVRAWQELGADFEIAAKRDGRDEVVASLVASGSGSELFADMREEISSMQSAVERLVTGERNDVAELDSVLLLVDGATLGLAVILLGVGGILANSWILRPLDGLARSVQAVAGGSLRSTVTASGPPEFDDLAADVDAMRRRILAEVEEAERAREALAERGMVVLTLRDELAAGHADLPAGVALAGRFAPAQGIVAGDWFDVVRLGSQRVAIALVDVSGHGAGVGAFALRTKALTVAALQSHDPGRAFGWVAERLGDTGEQFLTGVIVVLDAATGTVRYASAGHPPLLLGGLTGIAQLEPTGPLLGPLPGTWSTAEVELPRGGVLVAYSDGLIEARDPDGQAFGVDRLTAIVERTQLDGPDAVADACLLAVQQHQAAREDDLTLCVLSR